MTEYQIYKKVSAYLKEQQLLVPEVQILAGLSGGADSMALVDILKRYQEEHPEIPFELLAVHIHHGIRGEEADRDEQAAEQFCIERAVPYRVFHYDIPALAEAEGIGLEEAGRKYREQAFRSIETDKPCRIALAHHKNDLAETMLHHLARGTGLRGLAGILPKNGDKIRPLLCLTRDEIESYCHFRGIVYVNDSTNEEDAYTRNRIRHQVLPVLTEEVNPETVSHLAETALQISEADQLIRDLADQLLRKQTVIPDGFLFDSGFFEAPHIVQSYAVLQALKEISGKQKDFTAVHVQDILSLGKMPVSRSRDLPERLIARRTYTGIELFRRPESDHPENTGCKSGEKEQMKAVTLTAGRNETDFGTFSIEISSYHGEEIPEKMYTKWLDYDKIKSRLAVRNRRSGDYLVLNRKGQRKKLQRYFIDEKIPADRRDTIPLLVSEEEILWVIGGRISESCKVSVETRKVYKISYEGGSINERKDQSTAQ